MSIHKSLRIRSGLTRARNVWTRIERIEALQEKGDWNEEQSVYGLRKVRTRFKQKKIESQEEQEE